jgi:tellurite resistance protein TerC
LVAAWVWVVFVAGMAAMMVIDVLVFHRRAVEVRIREAAAWTAVWLVLALAFAGVVWAWRGGSRATEYLTGYLIERSLSIDNLFVLAVIFTYFAVPSAYRYRALLWGVIGALVLRAAFITVGAAALDRFAWTAYLLGGLLVATGLRLAVREIEVHPERNLVVRALGRLMPMTSGFHGQRFFVRVKGEVVATPMLAVLVAIASTDVAFAADSVPAIFAVTDDPFLVFAANAFSVLGMLAAYFLLAGVLDRFRYLRPGLAAILVFVGIKMSLSHVYDMPTQASLAVVVSILAAAIAGSVLRERSDRLRLASRAADPMGAAVCVTERPRRLITMFDGFHSVLVGVDGSAESLAALEQARRLLAEQATIAAVTICDELLAVHAGFNARQVAADIHDTAVAAQAQAAEGLKGTPHAETRLLHGKPTRWLLAAAKEERADLVAVGSHEHGRAAAIVIGSVASEILHHAHESVLVARPGRHEPTRIVVGVDGSPTSIGAFLIARELAAREGAQLVPVAAAGGKGVDEFVLEELGLDPHPGHPVEVLTSEAVGADLLIVGSRGLHGLAALGSVSERVAHHAPCSVLVVRGAAVARALLSAQPTAAVTRAGGKQAAA